MHAHLLFRYCKFVVTKITNIVHICIDRNFFLRIIKNSGKIQ